MGSDSGYGFHMHILKASYCQPGRRMGPAGRRGAGGSINLPRGGMRKQHAVGSGCGHGSTRTRARARLLGAPPSSHKALLGCFKEQRAVQDIISAAVTI